MLSNTNSPASDPQSKLSRKARRAALHKTTSSSPESESPRPSIPDAAQGDDDTRSLDGRNPYIEVFNKKIRALKKKLTKLEKYEQSEKKDLNADQIQALERKPETVCAVKELEDIVKQVAAVEEAEARANARKQRETEEEMQRRVGEAVQEVKDASAQATKEMLQLFYVLNVLLPNLSTSTINITEEQYTALWNFRAFVTGVDLQNVESDEDFTSLAQDNLNKFLERRQEPFYLSVTYADLWDVVDAVLHPPAPPKFGVDAAEETPTEPTASFFSGEQNEEEYPAAEEQSSAAAGPTFGGISFFNPSEVLDMPPDAAASLEIQTESTEITTEHDGVTTHLIVETTTVSIPETSEAQEEANSVQPEIERPTETVQADIGEQQPQGGQQQQRPNRGRGRGRGGFGRARGGHGYQNRGGQFRGGFRSRGRGGQQ